MNPQPGAGRGRFGINIGSGNEPGFSYPDLMNKLAATGVQWAYVPVFWSWLEPEGTGTGVYGPYAKRYHDYDPTSLSQLDQALGALETLGVRAVIQLRSQPSWATGSTGNVTATGSPPSDGEIVLA